MYKNVAKVCEAKYKVRLFEAGQLIPLKSLRRKKNAIKLKMGPMASRSPSLMVDGKGGEQGTCLLSLSRLSQYRSMATLLGLGGNLSGSARL